MPCVFLISTSELTFQMLTGDLGGKAKTHEYARAIMEKF